MRSFVGRDYVFRGYDDGIMSAAIFSRGSYCRGRRSWGSRTAYIVVSSHL